MRGQRVPLMRLGGRAVLAGTAAARVPSLSAAAGSRLTTTVPDGRPTASAPTLAASPTTDGMGGSQPPVAEPDLPEPAVYVQVPAAPRRRTTTFVVKHPVINVYAPGYDPTATAAGHAYETMRLRQRALDKLARRQSAINRREGVHRILGRLRFEDPNAGKRRWQRKVIRLLAKQELDDGPYGLAPLAEMAVPSAAAATQPPLLLQPAGGWLPPMLGQTVAWGISIVKRTFLPSGPADDGAAAVSGAGKRAREDEDEWPQDVRRSDGGEGTSSSSSSSQLSSMSVSV